MHRAPRVARIGCLSLLIWTVPASGQTPERGAALLGGPATVVRAPALWAQRTAPESFVDRRPVKPGPVTGFTASQRVPQQAAAGTADLGAVALSALVPGLGQRRLGQRRRWAYWAVEAIGWFVYLDRASGARSLRDDYRDFAWAEGRIQAGARVDGDFRYYETLTYWTRSGAFDRDPSRPGIQPETDRGTFNGSIWARASGIYLGSEGAVGPDDPAYQRALAYYELSAFGSEFLWDWTGRYAAQAEFADLIDRSDGRFRQATHAFGAVLANHAVSAIDAYLSSSGIDTPVQARVRALPAFEGGGWELAARFAWGSVGAPGAKGVIR